MQTDMQAHIINLSTGAEKTRNVGDTVTQDPNNRLLHRRRLEAEGQSDDNSELRRAKQNKPSAALNLT